jgi:hypothetical protein
VQLKKEHPSRGAPKIREKLRRLHTEIFLPAISTLHTVLDRHGLVSRGRRARYKAEGTTLEQPRAPNDRSVSPSIPQSLYRWKIL